MPESEGGVLNLNKFLMFILLALACIIPAVLLSTHEYTDGFYTSAVVPRITMSLNADTLVTTDIPGFYFLPQYAGLDVILLLIAKICGLSAQQLQFLPIGGIILPLLYFALAKKLFGSNLIASLIALFAAYDPTIAVKCYSTYSAAWTFPLFIAFIILYVRILKQEGKIGEILLMLLVFIAISRLNWSLPVFVIVLSVFISLILLIRLVIGRQREASNQAIFSLTLTFIVIYLIWDTTLYGSYLPAMVSGAGREIGVFNFEMMLEQLGLMRISAPLPYSYPPPISPLVHQLFAIRYIVISLPVAAYVLVKIKEVITKRRLKLGNIDVHSIVIWSFIGLFLWHIISYAAYGRISLATIAFFFPFVAIACLGKLKARSWLKLAVPIILVLLALLSFVFYLQDTTPQVRYSDTDPSAGWLAGNCEQQPKIVGCFDITSKYVANGVSYGVLFAQYWPDSDTYAQLIEPEFTLSRNDYLKENYDYVVLDEKFNHLPSLSAGWQFFEPLSNYLDEISRNINLSKVYNDGTIWICRPR